jgi:hypothetical protein
MMFVLGPRAHEGADVEHHGSFFQTLFEAAGVWAPLTLGVLAVALVVNVAWLYRSLNRRVNGAALGMQLRKLIAAGNEDRAVRLCRAAEGAVATQVALAGLNARAKGQDPYSAMVDVRQAVTRTFGKGFTVALAVGAAGLVESVVMVGAAASKGFPGNEIGAISIVPSLIAGAMALNAMQWSAMKRDIEAVIAAVR